MTLTGFATRAVERAPLPDALTRLGVGYLVDRARRDLDSEGEPGLAEEEFVRHMTAQPIASNTAEANAQHYELPPSFFSLILGPRLKYSSGLYGSAGGLPEAEDRALAETCVHANLADGQDILELGCGWGSLTLWMAQAYPGARITAVSNSAAQKAEIEARASALSLNNINVITADMNTFQVAGRFDRVVSVEMFEHMSNWRDLLERVAGWLKPGGRLFVHVFCHRDRSYRFNDAADEDWIAQHFFTGGIMPGHGLIRRFPEILQVEAEWRWSGEHYRRTAMDWLANFDRNSVEIDAVLRDVYGADAGLWRRRWRLFFLATAGLFGARGGEVWGVSHYRLRAPEAIP